MPPISLQFDGRLTNVAIQHKNEELIADMVLPPTPVPNKKFTYKEYDKTERFTVPDTRVGPKSEPNEVSFNVTEKTGTCIDHGLKGYVSNEDIDNADAPISPMSDETEIVTNHVRLAKEKACADTVFNASNYEAANQIDVAGAWGTLSTDALSQLEAGIDQCFMRPTVLVMGGPTWRKLARNETLLAALKGTLAPQQVKGGGIATPTANIEELAKYLGLSAVLIGWAQINTVKKGPDATYARIWDGTNAGKGGAALLRVNPGSALRDVVWAANFAWKQRQVFTNDTTRGAYGGKEVRVSETYVHHIVAKDVGYLFKDCLVT